MTALWFVLELVAAIAPQDPQPAAPKTRIYAVKRVVTLNPARPGGTAVAVAEGKVVAVGELAELERAFDPHSVEVDHSLADKVIVPGFVDGNSHWFEGLLWQYPYIGYHDRYSPDGKLVRGTRTRSAAQARLRAAAAATDAGIIAWGAEPMLYPEGMLLAADLDQVSDRRPVFVLHGSTRVATVNTVALRIAQIDASTAGVYVNAERKPTGEISGVALQRVLSMLRKRVPPATREKGMRDFARLATRVGITTATEMGSADLHNHETIEVFRRLTDEADFPLRLVAAYDAAGGTPAEQGAAYVLALQRGNSDRLRFGLVSLTIDGDLASYTAALNYPGYHRMAEMCTPLEYRRDELTRLLTPYHKAGLSIHVHATGDGGIALALDTLAALLRVTPVFDHRYTIENALLATGTELRRMARLGAGANFAINQVYYTGDLALGTLIGPERAQHMAPIGTARREGVRCALGSGAPVTPLGPLFAMWVAVNRKTLAGTTLATAERLSIEEALRAVTIDAATALGIEDEVGTIEAGKRADFAVLDQDPLQTPKDKLKDIVIWGTVLGGIAHPAR